MNIIKSLDEKEEEEGRRSEAKCARIIKWVVFIFIPFIYISSSFSLRLIWLIWHAPYIYLVALKAHENAQYGVVYRLSTSIRMRA